MPYQSKTIDGPHVYEKQQLTEVFSFSTDSDIDYEYEISANETNRRTMNLRWRK